MAERDRRRVADVPRQVFETDAEGLLDHTGQRFLRSSAVPSDAQFYGRRRVLVHTKLATSSDQQHHAAGLAEAQRRLNALAEEGLFERHALGLEAIDAGFEGGREFGEPLFGRLARTAEIEDAGADQTGLATSAAMNRVANLEGRARFKAGALALLQLDTSVAADARSGIDAEDSHRGVIARAHAKLMRLRPRTRRIAVLMAAKTFVALLLAAGKGTRFGVDQPKTWLELDGAAILVWSARRLAQVSGHVATVLASDEAALAERVPEVAADLDAAGVTLRIVGGATRQQSCQRAFDAARAIEADLVLVHDAARPFFDIAATERALAAAWQHGGAILGHRARDTLKLVDGAAIHSTIDRSSVFHAATPQVFRRDAFEAMLEHAALHGVEGTDEAGLAEACSIDVRAVEAPSTNIKITYPEDMLLLPALTPLLRRGRADDEGTSS